MNLEPLSWFSVERILPNTLSDHQIDEVRISMQEAWSSDASLGELAKCDTCWKIYSKESLFSWLPGINTKKDSVTEILDTIWMHESGCACRDDNCDGSLYFPYGKQYNSHLRDYFASRANGILVLIRDTNRGGRIVWFEWGYPWSFETVFHEFKDHYAWFQWDDFERAITNALGNMPTEFFVWAYIGIDQYYRRNIRVSMNILMLLLDTFSKSVPDNIVWITETDRRNVLHRLMTDNGAHSLGLDSSEYWRTLLEWKSHPLYQSDILVHPSPNQWYQSIIRHISQTVNKTSRTLETRIMH